MRLDTITRKARPRRSARYRVLAIALALCALAIPASASADPAPDGYATPNAIIGGSSGPASSSGAPQVDSGYSSVNAITGSDSGAPVLLASSPSSTDDGFDWASAGVGAGAAFALVALGGAALLTARRRAATSPSASAS